MKQEVYEGDSRVWKENAEWGPGGGCCRKMVPIEPTGNGQAAEIHAHVGTSRTSSASSTSSSGTISSASSNGTTSSANGSGGGSGCCGHDA